MAFKLDKAYRVKENERKQVSNSQIIQRVRQPEVKCTYHRPEICWRPASERETRH